ncbi:TetR/AcrR family transcriptional regulator [Roseomonas sp. CECT 9278]|uniref:TetR/AcrR family transcriptional regulator n=1 Tax=Roseomonas sp. CECT 9278 TaxID=2845823 RepID=UPI001E62C219|nr:TetR/AcrR family transcriptional regulator [Roseomonas sp. CECT 9278]CAH0125564.1 HTH-type transcriptional repressor ComR [Roseomonas sp. CECT 9278]
MARAREFDDDAVLDAATDRFWRQGYAATSVRDLGAAMGLVPASLYNAFGSKHALFALCLDRYLDRNMRERIARLEARQTPRVAIETFMNEIVARSLADPRGCLLVNSALEVAPHDAEIGTVIAARLGELEAFFHRCVLAGQRDGSIAAAPPARDLARLLLTTVMGLRVLARSKPEPVLLRGAARQVLALLDPPFAEQST